MPTMYVLTMLSLNMSKTQRGRIMENKAICEKHKVEYPALLWCPLCEEDRAEIEELNNELELMS